LLPEPQTLLKGLRSQEIIDIIVYLDYFASNDNWIVFSMSEQYKRGRDFREPVLQGMNE
jgi:hypothetical protein